MPAKLQARPPLLLAVLGIILYIGLAYLSPLLEPEDRAPENAVQTPAISKQEAAVLASDFIRQRFELSDTAKVETLFQSHTVRSGYLQHAGLEEEYEKKYGEQFPIDYFEVEITDDALSRNYYVGVNYTTKHIFSYSAWKDAAAKSGALPAASEASPAAAGEKALRDMGYDPAAFTLQDSGRPSEDYGLVYVSRSIVVGEAPLELHLGYENGRITSFRPAFPPPDSFLTWQEAQDERSGRMTQISLLGSLLLSLTALILVIRHRRHITFSRGLMLTLVFLGIYVMNNFNMLPSFRTMHNTGPSEPNALLYLWIMNIYVTLMALSTYFALLAGRKLCLDTEVEPLPAWRDEQFGGQVYLAMKDGYIIGLFILGVQQALFFAGSYSFDIWAVSDPGSSVYNMRIPELFPLLAWSAAISEEAVYRLLGVTLLLKLTRSPFVAVLLPSILWAMSHTQYPIYPVYTRLIEVSVIGVIFGYVFLRYGFLTAVFAHATMDSILMGLSLVYSGDEREAAAGIVYFFVPAAAGWIIYKIHSRLKRRPPGEQPPRAMEPPLEPRLP
ncbi:CPBP family intramembrane glutamic endopeptidase [Paenibacillus sp. YYML68]|uniref:CPBP family intramembrane glutamic endopeptidase n=1 Tax=Paenibacillus sp. YYML68 TaxID=2909250 RepID=UPI0024926B75|nr:type II CAAX endopeptidase family protein [Paenibacillus sp. YYML68]